MVVKMLKVGVRSEYGHSRILQRSLTMSSPVDTHRREMTDSRTRLEVVKEIERLVYEANESSALKHSEALEQNREWADVT